MSTAMHPLNREALARQPEPQRSIVNGNLSKLSTTNWCRCTANEYRQAATGHCHILFYNRLMLWDHGAGWHEVREALFAIR